MEGFLQRLKKRFWTKIRGADDSVKFRAYHTLAMDLLNEVPDTPMNDCKKRIQIIDFILENYHFEQIIETGIFYGATTRYFCKKSPSSSVTGIEIDKLFYAFTKKHSKEFSNLTLINSSSEAVLQNYAQHNIDSKVPTLFYLDAHWNEYLPLRDELKTITTFKNSLIIIDDFKVETNPNFKYDTYGLFNQKKLCLSYIKDLVQSHYVYFPNYEHTEEGSDTPSGAIYITASPEISTLLSDTKALKQYTL